MLKAPPWLFSAESDEYHHTRVTAEHWHVDPPPQALIHFVCSRWPGSGGRKVATAAPDPSSQRAPARKLQPGALSLQPVCVRKVAMRLYGKWFAPDIEYAVGKPVPVPPGLPGMGPPRQPPSQLVAFSAPVPLTRGERNPKVGSVIAWSQLLSLLAYETQRQATSS